MPHACAKRLGAVLIDVDDVFEAAPDRAQLVARLDPQALPSREQARPPRGVDDPTRFVGEFASLAPELEAMRGATLPEADVANGPDSG